MPENFARDLANARERLAAIESEVRALAQVAEGVKFAGEQTVRLYERVDGLREDLHDFKNELDSVAQGCRDVLGAVATLKNNAENQRRAWGARERWLLALAGIFGSGAVTLFVELLTRK